MCSHKWGMARCCRRIATKTGHHTCVTASSDTLIHHIYVTHPRGMQKRTVRFNTRFTVADHNYREYLQLSSTARLHVNPSLHRTLQNQWSQWQLKWRIRQCRRSYPRLRLIYLFLEGGHLQLYPVVEFRHVVPWLQEYRRSQNMPAQEVARVQFIPVVVDFGHVSVFTWLV